MSITILSQYQALASSHPAGETSPAGISQSMMDLGQSPGFFPLAVQKQLRIGALKAFFKNRKVSRVFVGEDINRFEAENKDCEISSLGRFATQSTRTAEAPSGVPAGEESGGGGGSSLLPAGSAQLGEGDYLDDVDATMAALLG